MKKKLLSLVIAGALGTASLSAHAALTSGTLLDFTGTFTLDAGPSFGLIITHRPMCQTLEVCPIT